MQIESWLPLTEYAARAGISISTLRRKIKSSAIDYKMDGGKYLIKCDFEEGLENTTPEVLPSGVYFSSDLTQPPPAQVEQESLGREGHGSLRAVDLEAQELRWRALDARVSGLVKKIDAFSEQISELKMLVRIFEERLDEQK